MVQLSRRADLGVWAGGSGSCQRFVPREIWADSACSGQLAAAKHDESASSPVYDGQGGSGLPLELIPPHTGTDYTADEKD
jgi:hypothetical protein